MAGTLGTLVAFLTLMGRPSPLQCKEANVTCMVHDDCVLPCSFKPSGTVVVHWYKQQTPVHSYYYNKDQFGLQNKHFSGRTSLFNSQIVHGNASLLLKRVKVQDRGRYKCYTSTKKGNQETFVNLGVKAVIQSVNMEMSESQVSCSSHNIYPAPGVVWSTWPASPLRSLDNVTTRTSDHRGLFSVHSTLKMGANLSHHAYYCSVVSADRTQVWTASWRNQEDIEQEEGRELSVPCVGPQHPYNLSRTWTFAKTPEPAVVLRFDGGGRLVTDLWEGRAHLDPGDGSLWLQRPDCQEHTGTYSCSLSGPGSRHTVQTRVNITHASVSEAEHSERRSHWCTLSSLAFLLTIVIFLTLSHCLRERVTAVANGTAAPRRQNGVAHRQLNERLNVTVLHTMGPHTAQTPCGDVEPAGPSVRQNNGLQYCSVDNDASVGSIQSLPGATGSCALDSTAVSPFFHIEEEQQQQQKQEEEQIPEEEKDDTMGPEVDRDLGEKNII